MKRTWTTEQTHAINACGGSILVSAAAGSGKTSVLTERVIKKITQSQKPVDIDQFLIVTFTKASAEEMKARISARLQELILQNHDDENLQRQKLLLKTAQIGTIHSFCTKLLKENFFKLGISPKFRIAKDGELSQIKSSAMQKTLDRFFEINSEEHKMAADLFTDEKSDIKLSKIIGDIYEYTRSVPLPQKWMEEKLEIYDPENNSKQSVWEKEIINYTVYTAAELLKIASENLEIASSQENLSKAYGKSLSLDKDALKQLLESAEKGSFEEIYSFLNNFKFGNIGTLRDKNLEHEKNIIKAKREYIKKSINDLNSFYSFSKNYTDTAAKTIQKILKVIFETVKYYGDEIESSKMLKNVLDFSDLEHKTLELLIDNTDQKLIQSNTAKEISEKFEEIMVDEYQDINELQSTIFKMLSRNEENIFMVGDVKQSIYKFRESRPEIFLNKKANFSVYDPEIQKYPAKILLGKNFRSSAAIIDGINFIFKKLMSKYVGDMEYGTEEALINAANYPKIEKHPISVKLIDNQSENEDKHVVEAKEIAKTIGELISNKYMVGSGDNLRPVTFSDFCILIRSANNCAHIYSNTLRECGIPAYCETNEKFLKTQEISTIISLLEVINNPTLDVFLASTMLAPFFGFTINDIAEIRGTDQHLPLYFAIKKFAELNKEDNKIEHFLKKIKYYRTLSHTYSCAELIELIYSDTKYPEICLSSPNGHHQKANLIKLTEYAKNFDKEFHFGLSGFLNFIHHIKINGEDLKPAEIYSDSENTVKIMSIHKSKGLEFPVCIVADLDHKFNCDKDDLLIHPNLGIGFKLKNESETLVYDNPIHKAILLQNSRENLSEEMRILYVALTRAKQKLILSSVCKNPHKKIEEIFALTENSEHISPHIIQHGKSFLDWILLALSQSNLKTEICNISGIPNTPGKNENAECLDWDFEIVNSKNDLENFEETAQSTAENNNSAINEEFLQLMKDRFDFEYKDKHLINVPLKISASELAHEDAKEEYIASSKPEFMSKKGLTPMHRGTAMHEFACYCDINELTADNAKNQAKKLLEKGFLTSDEFDSLDIYALKKFADSDLAQRISKSKNVLREHRFCAKVPESKIFETADSHVDVSIIVQGAMDCAFEEGGEYVIVDYKTDKAHDTRELCEKYKKQLKIYKYALEATKNVNVKEIGIYSFYLNEYSPITD